MRTSVLVGVLGFTTNQGIQDGGQRGSQMRSNAMNAGLQEVYTYRELSNYEKRKSLRSRSMSRTLIILPK